MNNLGSLLRGLLKLVALVGGSIVTVICLMSVAGRWIEDGSARAGIAIVVALIVPVVLADRALARLSPERVAGVPTDVLALTYMGFVVAFVVAAHGATGPLLRAEGARLAESGRVRTSKLAYLLAGEHYVPVATPSAETTAVAAPQPAENPSAASVAAEGLRKGDGKERTPAQIFTDFAPAVVTINVGTAAGDGGGTGFVIDAAGTIGTNHHVIDNADKITVKLMDGTVIEDVEILVVNEPLDLALLKIKPPKSLASVVLGDSDKITVGERLVSIGNPLGLEHTLTDGLASARRVIQGRKMIQMSTPVSPGNSGGPLFNSRGEVVGVTTAGYGGGLAQNLNLAMPINDVKAMIKRDYPGRHKPGAAPRSERW